MVILDFSDLSLGLDAKNKALERELNSVKVVETAGDAKVLQDQMSTATNQFFDARVAVLGFKCKMMQIQGELEDARVQLALRNEQSTLPPSSLSKLTHVRALKYSCNEIL